MINDPTSAVSSPFRPSGERKSQSSKDRARKINNVGTGKKKKKKVWDFIERLDGFSFKAKRGLMCLLWCQGPADVDVCV